MGIEGKKAPQKSAAPFSVMKTVKICLIEVNTGETDRVTNILNAGYLTELYLPRENLSKERCSKWQM
ncbi:hypothetical protein [Planococcus halotolerans]|uniref:Uncharacterized protein n=1 Tax=Planococcus halotolerans TaxID=2233542 RepID=A0A365KRR2_9BACL|nr:hypothetical protein [Planococcus halotolerans]RAZ75679.1 hypothetical protein DP120_12825 [Planococcus halotolerans]